MRGCAARAAGHDDDGDDGDAKATEHAARI
jgi:hypothetical protein